MLPDHPEALNRIQRQVVRLQQLIDDLLVIAKSEAGVVIARPSSIAADVLAQLVVDDCRPAAETSHIALHSRVTTDGLLEVDVALIRRCLENLVLNAIKFSPAGTTVTLDIVRSEAGTRIDVGDEGPGIPDAIRASLFERFVTGVHRNANVAQTGLGLAFSRMAVEAHGGTIAVRPRPAGGSIFRIELPPVIPGERAG
jgi:signal transduction histidine kinase